MQVGLSKMLPQVALGQTQSSILATAYFENDILDLVRVFILRCPRGIPEFFNMIKILF